MKFVLNKSNQSRLLYAGLLVIIFAISVFVRSNQFGLRMGRHHEWLTCHALQTMRVWDAHGAFKYGFSPVYNFDYKGDKLDYSMVNLFDKNENGYYVSYGPFGFILPYIVFAITGAPINPTSLIAFNLAVHFFTALFLYLAILRLGKKRFDEFYFPALGVFTMYIFSPGTLWFHSNVYFSEILVQLFIAAGWYVFVLLNEQEIFKRKTLIWLGVVCFFAVYTEWLGVFFIFLICAWWLVLAARNKKYFKPLLVAAGAGIAALLLIFWQYSSIGGVSQLLSSLRDKFISRSGTVSGASVEEHISIYNAETWGALDTYLNQNFINVINILAFVIPGMIICFLLLRKITLTRNQTAVIVLCLLLPLAHQFIFFTFTVIHDFSMLKLGMGLILVAGIGLIHIDLFMRRNKWMLVGFIVLAGALVVEKSYVACNRYQEINNVNTVVTAYDDLGNMIKAHVKPHEPVFTNLHVHPISNYYAGRNVRMTQNGSEAITMARLQNTNVYFYKAMNGEVSIIKYTPTGDSTVSKAGKIEIQP